MTEMLIVDWLGRGGIAQTAETWLREARELDLDVDLIGLSGREIAPTIAVGAGSHGRVGRHRALIREVANTIRERRPSTVVVHNFLVPALERRVFDAARSVGARMVFVVHNDRHHTRSSGFNFGLSALVDRSDTVITHSAYVADRLADRCVGAPIEVTPLPMLTSVLAHPRPATVLGAHDRATCLTLGTRRATKSADLGVEIARLRSPAWRFAWLGGVAEMVGDPPADAVLMGGFVDPGTMCRATEEAAVMLLPYSAATQSGAVVLARSLGCVPVASAVGGLPEQIDDGVDGVLVEADADSGAWAAALDALEDEECRTAMVMAGRARLDLEHAAFCATVSACAPCRR